MASLQIHLQYGTPAFVQYKARARQAAIQWARNMLAIPSARLCLLDTETTGLDENAEVIQVGLLDGAGQVLMDNVLCKPVAPIPPDATAIHHITNALVAKAPEFTVVYRDLMRLVEDRVVVIYNKAYDLRIIRQSLARFNMALPFAPARVECAMLQYADYVGDWNEYHQNFKWQKLAGGDHSALGDCRATLDLIRRMARNG
jgi:DNA polymerase-3 subunit epsilon